mmetsp:Transcript_17389/g.69875  ORF Transcript_17389/g.69875 Transcript_17389/m.69875 type:complete len:440 (-) Transcript_17389:1056-2375(-)
MRRGMVALTSPVVRRAASNGTRSGPQAAMSAWAGVEAAPADPIIGLTQAFKDDPASPKVLLGVGAYRDDAGKPYVLPSIREAEKRVVAEIADHEYAPIAGLAEFLDESLKFAYGDDCEALRERRIAAVQALSGTGACRLAAALIARLPSIGGSKAAKPVIYMPEPTWGNHPKIAKDAGLEVKRYRYLDASTKTTLDIDGLLEDVASNVEDGATIMFHACAHNPTGVDPTPAQWAAISATLKQRPSVQIFFDCAYQGFASGDAEADAAALRTFVADGHAIMLAQSYAKNFGLYGERVGALSAVCADAAEARALESQLKVLIRPMYSSPPVHGAKVVAAVLKDPALRAQWSQECAGMAARIKAMRALLKTSLEAEGSTKDWSHVTDQIGMFAFTGLSEDQVKRLRAEFHVYCTLDGRISVAGLTEDNVKYVAAAMHAVTSS